ncbi:hypothetical protein HG15A2_04970 [Adhaeretor mobilis]|uniref:Uncharacterized protein n=1 Tax=Adhaeretor mobilis TaxID=1930276 RepID=A0A517MQS5_9BACT|nr:hypothetical protein HG15A2_04970 [Adhaeretor mobilis]
MSLLLLACFCMGLLAMPAAAATASELLEKAIYAQETVGDLDKAIDIYEQVLNEHEKSAEAAAQAQYRIGLCYEKLGKADKAAGAFQAVIDDFPSAKEWVKQAKGKQPGAPDLLPVPWGDGDEMIMEIKLPNGLAAGQQVFRIAKAEHEGRPVWECDAWQTITLNGMAGKSHVLVDFETFAPIESQWKHTLLGEAQAVYGNDQVEIELAGKDKPSTKQLDSPYYDNEQAAELFRRLPLREGYKAKFDVVAILNNATIPLGLEVTEIETVEVPAGKFECFKLELDIKQTFWISNDEHRYIVKFVAGGAIAELTEIRQAKPNESKLLEGKGFRVTLPPGWYAYAPGEADDEGKTGTTLIGPNASINARIETGPLGKIKEKHDSPRDWAEHALEHYGKQLGNLKLSEKGIEIIKIGDREAVAVEFEYREGKVAKRARRICVFGESTAANLRFTTERDDFEKLVPSFEEIVSSLTIR